MNMNQVEDTDGNEQIYVKWFSNFELYVKLKNNFYKLFYIKIILLSLSNFNIVMTKTFI